ncbi:MAG TPA: hypothetical protein VIM65_13860 [Cyclobacteriaceae bacterium]
MIKTANNRDLILFCVLIIGLSVSVLIEWWVRDCGFIMTPDSDNYISASRSFRESGIFLSPDGSRYSNWPPLFPVILSLFNDPAFVMIWITLFCKIIIGCLVLYLANHFLHHTFYKIIFLLATFLSVHFLLISVFLWSEILFMTLLLIYTYFAFNHYKKPTLYYYLLLLTGFLLCLQRNAGLFWVTATALWFVINERTPLLQRLIKNGLLVLVSASGLIFWHFYNVFMIEHASPFHKRPFFSGVFLNIEMISSCLGKSFFPSAGIWSVLLGLVIALILALYGVKYFRADNSITLLVLGIIIYTLGFLPIPRLDIHDMERYFAVVLPVFLLFPLIALENVSERFPHRAILIRICLIIWSVYPVSRMVKNAMQWHNASCAGVSDK